MISWGAQGGTGLYVKKGPANRKTCAQEMALNYTFCHCTEEIILYKIAIHL